MSNGNNKQEKPPSANPAIAAINTPSFFETAMQDRFKNFSNWQNKPGPRDILDAPGMGDMADIYGTAESLANEKRMGNPMVALSGGGSGDYAKQLDALTKQNRYDTRAAGLSRGLGALKDEAYGYGGSAASLESNRKTAYAGAMSNQENQYYNRPKPTPWWQTAIKAAVGGASAFGA